MIGKGKNEKFKRVFLRTSITKQRRCSMGDKGKKDKTKNTKQKKAKQGKK